MKKRLLTTALVILIIIIGALSLTSCKDGNTHKGIKTIDISTAEELRALHGSLGSDYDGITYVLKNDIDLSDANWEPLGKNFENAFCSDFDGGGYSITGVRILSDTASEERESSSVVGFFGFTYNSTITNLTLSIDTDFVYDTEITYAGGLIGYAYGDTVLQNITVNGEITAAMESADYSDIKIYMGGVIGSSTGSISLSGITNNAAILADRMMGEGVLGLQTEKNRAHTVYAGGVAGYIRTVDLSVKQQGASADADNLIDNVINNGDVTVYAERLNGGGVFGSVYNSTRTNNIKVTSDSALLFDSVLRSNAGGVIGYADRVALTDAACNAVIFEVARKSINQYQNKIFNAGGLVGYAANNTLISDSAVDTVSMLDSAVDFAGGLVGVLSDSGIYDCTSKGRFINKSRASETTFTMYDIFGDAVIYSDGEYVKDTKSKLKDTNPRKWAGAVGKLFGGHLESDTESKIGRVSDIDIDFEAYHAVICTKIDRVKAGEKVDGEQLFESYSTNIIDGTIVFTPQKVKFESLYGVPRAQDPQE